MTSETPGKFATTASVKAYNFDTKPGDDTASATTTVLPAADLAVGILPSYSPSGNWMVIVANVGPQSAVDAELVVTMPAGASYGGSSLIDVDGQEKPSGCVQAGTDLHCPLGTLPITDSFQPPFSPQILLKLSGSGPLKAVVSSKTGDQDPGNNEASAELSGDPGGGTGGGVAAEGGPGDGGSGCGCRASRRTHESSAIAWCVAGVSAACFRRQRRRAGQRQRARANTTT